MWRGKRCLGRPLRVLVTYPLATCVSEVDRQVLAADLDDLSSAELGVSHAISNVEHSCTTLLRNHLGHQLCGNRPIFSSRSGFRGGLCSATLPLRAAVIAVLAIAAGGLAKVLAQHSCAAEG